MNDPNRLPPAMYMRTRAGPAFLRPGSSQVWVAEFKQQLTNSIGKHEIEEINSKENNSQMPLKDSLTLFQKLANAEYLQKVISLKSGTLDKNNQISTVNGKRALKREQKQYEILKIDKEKLKRHKIETELDVPKVKQLLEDKELFELNKLAKELEKNIEIINEDGIAHFKYILKRNSELASVTLNSAKIGTASLREIDMKLLKLILTQYRQHMYTLVSFWLYQEYNLSLTRTNPICFHRYEDILKEFFNSIESMAAEELFKNIEEWANFINTLPFLTKSVYQNIYAMCTKDDPKLQPEPFYTIPLKLLKDLILSSAHKETVNQKALKKLLRLTVEQKDSIKLQAIKIISPEFYKIPKFTKTIFDFAVESFTKLKEFKGTEDENAIKNQIGLLLRISAEDPKILIPAMQIFGNLKDNAKRIILIQCKKMFEKCWPPTKEELKDVFIEMPPAGISLIQIYVDVYKNVSFPGPLKQSLISLAKKIQNYEILQNLIPQISQIEIDKNELIESAAKAKYPRKKEFIHGLVQNIAKSTDYCEKLKKILTKLHLCDKETDVGIYLNIVETIDICIDKKELFQLNEVVLPTLADLAKREKVSLLLPRTLVKVTIIYPNAIIECLKIVKILLERKPLDINIEYGLKQYLTKNATAVRENIWIFLADQQDWILSLIPKS